MRVLEGGANGHRGDAAPGLVTVKAVVAGDDEAAVRRRREAPREGSAPIGSLLPGSRVPSAHEGRGEPRPQQEQREDPRRSHPEVGHVHLELPHLDGGRLQVFRLRETAKFCRL